MTAPLTCVLQASTLRGTALKGRGEERHRSGWWGWGVARLREAGRGVPSAGASGYAGKEGAEGVF